MSEVFVYVEGPSDQLGMRELFAEVMELATNKGSTIDFYPLNGKEPLLNKGPIKAINILRNRPNSYVFLVPDLYPPNKPFPHVCYTELKNELKERFDQELHRKGCDERMVDHFFIPITITKTNRFALFSNAGMKYKDTADVPWVLKRSSHSELTKKCPQNFKPFVEDLFKILGVELL